MKIFLIIVSVFVFSFSPFVVTAQTEPAKTLNEVSKTTKSQIRERLKSYLQYHRTQNWQKLYDLLADNRIRESFVSDQFPRPNDGADFILEDFIPQAFALPNKSMPDWVILEGCAKIIEVRGKKNRYEAMVNIYKIDGAWKFTMIEFMRQIGQSPQPCKN